MDLADIGNAISLLLEPSRLVWMLLGVGLGLVVGLIPGLGGMVGLTIIFPFIYGMDPYSGIALMLGLAAVTTMSDSFPAVLLGIPGTSAAAATIMDGYPLAKKGKATRTLGTVFFVSGVGGVVGAVALLAVIPIARPLVLALESPELLMFVLLGISMVGILSRGSALKGLAGAMFGLLLSSVGASLVGTDYRYTFDALYLYDGLSIIVVAMGLFAVPEIIDMLVSRDPASKRRAVEQSGSAFTEILSGVRDAVHHRWLLLRSSIAGVLLGAVPGLGGSVIDWLLYGTTIQTSKDKSRFGKGDIRGVIAPESAANAKEGGALMPTLFFGIPGSGQMAVLLGGFLLLGIEVGPDLVRNPEGNTIVLLIVWTLVLANIVSMFVCMGLSRHMVRLSQLPPRTLAPFLMVLIALAAYQAHRSIYDVVALLVLGMLGWGFKQFGWSRPAVLIGFVLGEPAERYLTISITRYGADWLLRPWVIAIGALIIASIVIAARFKPERVERAALEKKDASAHV